MVEVYQKAHGKQYLVVFLESLLGGGYFFRFFRFFRFLGFSNPNFEIISTYRRVEGRIQRILTCHFPKFHKY